MRIKLSCNAAGDVRLICLRDKKHMRKIEAPQGALLVCSPEVQEMTTGKVKGVKVGHGKISTRNTFTRYARQRLREAGAVIDSGPLSSCVFLTGTLPGSTTEACAALAGWSGWAIQTVEQWLRDKCPNSVYFGVWEYQRRGALHIHLCVRTSSKLEADNIKALWKARWILILDGIAEKSGVDVYARKDGGTWKWDKEEVRVDAQTVEKSVGNYLSKYLTKGSVKKRMGCDFPPSSWSFVAKPLLAVVAQSRLEIEVSQVSQHTAIALFERIGGEVVSTVDKCFAYSLPFDVTGKALIALAKPVQASMLFDYIAGAMRCLLGSDRIRKPLIVPELQLVASYFMGKWLRSCV